MDTILEIMIFLKNNWGLTGDLAPEKIYFSTRLYDERIQLPQIIIRPAGSISSPPIDVGDTNLTYYDSEGISFNIYVRPKQDSASSMGWAKNAIYQMRRETERLLRSGSTLVSDDDSLPKYIGLEGWRRMDNYSSRPPIFILSGQMGIIKHKTI